MAAHTILSHPMPILTGLTGALLSLTLLLWGNKHQPKRVPVPAKKKNKSS